MRRATFAAFFLLAGSIAAGVSAQAPALDAGPKLIVGFGALGLKDHDETAATLDVEVRGRPTELLGLYLQAGALATSDESFHLRAGFGRDFDFAERWSVGITTAVGYWEPGDGKDLGHDVEFRSALELGYESESGWRWGLSLSHLSNASLSEDNPGVEILMVTFGRALPWRR